MRSRKPTRSEPSSNGVAAGAADGEDRDLRGIDDRGERRDAEHAEVRDGERAVVQVVELDLPTPGGVREPPRLRGDLGERLPVGVEARPGRASASSVATAMPTLTRE